MLYVIFTLDVYTNFFLATGLLFIVLYATKIAKKTYNIKK